MKRLIAHTILLSLVLLACEGQVGNAQSGGAVALVSVKNPQDQVNIFVENGLTVIDVESSVGIGSAEFGLDSGTKPRAIVVRLHVAGLEEFRLSSGQTAIAVSVASSSLFRVFNQRIISAGKESPITSLDPLWMNVRIVSDQMIPKIPLENGYFEITIPQKFIDEAGDSFQMQWIDFYR
jgi:hypothetical protein